MSDPARPSPAAGAPVNVMLQIGGRSYTVACPAGEEARLARLGALIDGKIAGHPHLAGQSESRRLLFAALLLADEADEASTKARADSAASARALATTLDEVALRLETLARHLEDPLANP